LANVEQTARQILDLLLNYLNQQPVCAPATAEAVGSLALPFMASVEYVRNVVYFGRALFWIIKQFLPEDNKQGKLIELLLKI
jgi:hypothetical protein